ncbi:MAG: PaaI family thioesterase [Syntrophomonadaceae bacterium]|nr:PaaI family thioesterase [Syntrophomonadaceae bacterium]
MQEYYRKLEEIYKGAPYNNDLFENTSITISEGQAVLSTLVLPRYCHSGGSMHGSAYFRMLDDAAYFAVQSLLTDQSVYTTSFQINLLRPVREGIIRSEGEVIFRSRKLYIAQSHLYDQHEKLVAFGTGHFMPVNSNSFFGKA